tara:strand:- start:357 stop:554 length:198 start_codon:yes stop_codon:yes gene_type:complete
MKRSFNHTSYNNFEKQLSYHMLSKYLSYLKKGLLKTDYISNEEMDDFITNFMIKNEDLFYTNKLK